MGYLHCDRLPGERIIIQIEGKEEPAVITLLGESPERPGQQRLQFNNCGNSSGLFVHREEDYQKDRPS